MQPTAGGISILQAVQKTAPTMVQGTLDLIDPEHAVMMASQVYIDYTNYRGERSVRLIQPVPNGVFWGSNEFHKEDQWLLPAIDVEKKVLRTFALRDIHGFDVNADGTRKR